MAISTREIYLILRARDEASRIVRGFATNMSQTGVALMQFGAAATTVGTSLAALGAGGLAFMKSNIDVASEYDRQARNALSQADQVGAKLEDVAEIGRRVAREVGVPFEELQETLFFIFGTMDVGIGEAETLLKAFAKEAVAGQTTLQEAGRSTIAILNGLNLSVEEATRVQDVLFQLIRKGDITYEELSKSIGNTISATNRAGQSIETTAAMMAFLTRTGLNAAKASTSAARALETISDPRVADRLRDIGISVKDATGEFRPLVDIMADMNDHMKDMSKPERTKFLQELFLRGGGTRQARRFWETALGSEGQFERFQQDIFDMNNAMGAFEERYELMANTTATKSELLRNKWMLVKEALGRALMPAFQQLLELIGKGLGWFDSLSDSVKGVVAHIITWGSVIAVAVGGFLTFIGVVSFFIAGIILAGKVLLVLAAVLAAVVIVVTGWAAAIALAWKNSENFREIVKGVGSVLKELWDIAVETAQGIWGAFKEKLLPPLQELWELIDSRVLPVLQSLQEMFAEEVVPKIREAGQIIEGMASFAFEHLGNIIREVVIPAISAITGWWEKNQEKIRPFLKILGQVVKWFLIIAAVIVGVLIVAFLGPIAAIGLIIAAVVLLIMALAEVWHFIKFVGGKIADLWNWVKDQTISIWNSIAEFFVGLWNGIVEFFVGVWNGIVEFLTMIWTSIVEAIQTGLNFVKEIWEGFWAGPFGELFKAIWELIIATLRFFTVLFAEIWKDWLVPTGEFFVDLWNTIKDFFVDVWNNIVDFATSTWESFTEGFETAWNAVKDFFVDLWNNVSDFFVGLWEDISGFVSDIWDEIYSHIEGPLNDIKNFISDALNAIRRTWSSIWGRVTEIVSEKWDEITDFISDSIQNVKDFFKNAKGWLYQAGRDIILGLIEGLTSMINSLTAKLNEITNKIPDWKGPKVVDLRLLEPSGKHIMEGFLRGIDRSTPALVKKLKEVTGTVEMVLEPPDLTSRQFFAPVGPRTREDSASKTINQTINISTQEIDPVRHAEEIGWLLMTARG